MPPKSLDEAVFRSIAKVTAGKEPWSFATRDEESLNTKLRTQTTPILDLPCSMSRGSSTGNDEIFMLRAQSGRFFTRDGEHVDIEKALLRTPIYATDFGRYEFSPSGDERVIFPYEVAQNSYRLLSEQELQIRFPKGFEYLRSKREVLKRRKQFKDWYSFSAPRNLDDHDSGHLMVPLLANTGLFCRLPEGGMNKYCPMASGGFTLRLKSETFEPEFLLGLMNSRLLFWRLQKISNIFRGGWITCTKQYVGTLPIKIPPQSDKTRTAVQNNVRQAVLQRQALEKAKTPQEKEGCRRQIATLEDQIDHLVYELYGLTAKEIAIVEEATRSD